MANPSKRVPENVPGDFFVDSTCIDCDACRQIAPSVFGEGVSTSFVKAQPANEANRQMAIQALLSCPTGSIGYLGDDDVKAVAGDFPLLVEHPVYYCGFNSPKSYGGNSYFIQHPNGNWLVDSPKYVAPIVKRLESLGGLRHIFLTHRDDIADADRFASYFGCERVIHRDELASQPSAERVLEGEGPWKLAPDFFAIFTPGHTKGHCVLLFKDRFLFTGDHVGLGPRRTATFGVARLLLALVAEANRVPQHFDELCFRMDTAGTWAKGAAIRCQNARRTLASDSAERCKSCQLIV